MHAGTETFLAAVQAAGSDPARVSEVLRTYVSDPPTADADDLILGPKGTGRTAELFASHASPLSALACMCVPMPHTDPPSCVAQATLEMSLL